MILPKIFNPETNSFEPDLSSIDLSKWSIKIYQLNADGETYTVDVEWIAEIPYKISQLQGKLLLAQMGLIDQIEAMINQAGRPEQIYWEYATEWERTSPILNRLAPTIGMDQDGLDQFFINASKIY